MTYLWRFKIVAPPTAIHYETVFEIKEVIASKIFNYSSLP
jgi:hypothetical protein